MMGPAFAGDCQRNTRQPCGGHAEEVRVAIVRMHDVDLFIAKKSRHSRNLPDCRQAHQAVDGKCMDIDSGIPITRTHWTIGVERHHQWLHVERAHLLG